MSTALEIGLTIAQRYTLREHLGDGDFSRVYRAEQLSTGQMVALKVLELSPDLDPAHHDTIRARFEREMHTIAALKHPNIVRLIDSGALPDGRPFAALEFVDGEPLSALIQRHDTRLTPDAARRVMGQALEALSAAHAQGVIHRDLTPHNIIITSTSGGPRLDTKVVDFGLASILHEHRTTDYRTLTQDGEIPGDPAYLAPEQIRAEPLTPAADIYAWGLILIETLTGEHPLHAASSSTVDLVMAHTDETPIPLPTHLTRRSPQLSHLLTRATAKDPAQRYAHAGLALPDLESWHPEHTLPTPQRSSHLILAIAALILACGALVLVLLSRDDTTPADAPASPMAASATPSEPAPPALDATQAADALAQQDSRPAPTTHTALHNPTPPSGHRVEALSHTPFAPHNRWMYRFERLPGEEREDEGAYARYVVVWTSLGVDDDGRWRIEERGGPDDKLVRIVEHRLEPRCAERVDDRLRTPRACLHEGGVLTRVTTLPGGADVETVPLEGDDTRFVYAPALGWVELEHTHDNTGDTLRRTLLGYEVGGRLGGLPIEEPVRCDWIRSRPVNDAASTTLELSGTHPWNTLRFTTPRPERIHARIEGGPKPYDVRGHDAAKQPYDAMALQRIKWWSTPAGNDIVVIERRGDDTFVFSILDVTASGVTERVVRFPAPAEGERYRSLLLQHDNRCFVRLEHVAAINHVADFAFLSDGTLAAEPFYGSLEALP